jgi:hypothetical protein
MRHDEDRVGVDDDVVRDLLAARIADEVLAERERTGATVRARREDLERAPLRVLEAAQLWPLWLVTAATAAAAAAT